MQIHKIADNYSVSGQITPADVPTIKAAGFNTIMCNRPDGESFGQPGSDMIKKAAEDLGMKFHYVPQGHSGISMNTLADFRKVIAEGEPVFAYCRSGNRCAMLWNAAHS